MNLRQIALAGLAALALGGAAVTQAGSSVPSDQAATPPPPPPPNGSVATPGTLIGSPVPAVTVAPSASPAPAGRGRGRGRSSSPEPGPSPSDTPEPPQFSTMDGVWEMAVQPLYTGKTTYSHLYVVQKGDALTGTWVRANNDKLNFTGTFDGRLFKLTATDAKNTAYTLSGYAENFSDMVGMLTANANPKDTGTPFTAAHRKKEKLTV